jgi:ubiquinone biosynthesis monooxygenase Coq7
VPFLLETLSHEVVHCQRFLDAMLSRNARPCNAMPLWGIGGSLLGLVTSLMGRNAVMVCTEAVEETVHRHLDEQMRDLAGRDQALREMIADIQVEEVQHLRFAQRQVSPSWLNGALKAVNCVSTEVVIWLSTQGAVTRMQRAIRSDRKQPHHHTSFVIACAMPHSCGPPPRQSQGGKEVSSPILYLPSLLGRGTAP